MSRMTIDWSLVPAQLGIWTFVCGLSAAPSFFLGGAIHSRPMHIAAMVTGVGLFIIAYTLISSSEWAKAARRDRAVRRTLYVGYGTRILLSIVFPVSLFLDGMLGAISIGVTEGVFGANYPRSAYYGSTDPGYLIVLFTTILQGCLLNVVLLVYMLIVYGIARSVMTKRLPEGVCLECGYDLRASREVCPECGAEVRDDLVRAQMEA